MSVDSSVKATGTATTHPYASLVTLFPRTSGATAAWAEGLTGQGISVSVLDSGVLPTATDLGSRVVQVSLAGQPSVSSGKLDDTTGHGTFVSDVLAGKSADGRHVGVAPDAKVYAVNAANSDGVYTTDIITGLSWVLANKGATNIRVVNMSLAESMPSSYQTSALDQAVEKLWQAGIVVVVTSGNLGANTMYYAPGNDPFVITVGASDSNDTPEATDDVVASFSSYGITGDGFLKPEIMATGRHIVSNVPAGSLLDFMAPAANHVEPGYLMATGTSFAAPQVAGAAAILLQKNASLTPNQIKWLLAATARPVLGSSAPGLDLAAAVAYSGTVKSANQGIAPSAGPPAATTSSANLNSGSGKDAVAYQRAAIK